MRPGADPVLTSLCSLLESAAKEVIPPERLHVEVSNSLKGVSAQSLEHAVRQAARIYAASSGEGYLLRILPGALSSPLKDIFVRGLGG